MRRAQRRQRTNRVRANVTIGVGATGWASRSGVTLDVTIDFRIGNSVTGVLLVFDRPLVLRAIDLAEVVDAGVLLSSGTSFHEVRDRDRCEEADDGHDDHDFHEREALLTIVLDLHTIYLSYAA